MTKPQHTPYARTIRIRLAEKGWSQADLAKALGLTKGLISHYLTGRRSGDETRGRITHILDLPDDTFSKHEDNDVASLPPSRPWATGK